jgi:hypothetical protein
MKHKKLTQRADFLGPDLLGERKVLSDAETGRDIDSREQTQLPNGFRATEIEVGLLFNFAATAQFGRYGFENEGKKARNLREFMEKKSPGSCA